MTDRRRYYLTTAIAYPNNRPGLHTLYEVIGADVIARWHRMVGDDTRFVDFEKLASQSRIAYRTTAALAEAATPPSFVESVIPPEPTMNPFLSS